MTYRGRMEHGVIVPEEPIDIENGVSVLFEVMVNPSSDEASLESTANGLTITKLLSRFTGKAQTLPADAAENLDHYLYGQPKK